MTLDLPTGWHTIPNEQHHSLPYITSSSLKLYDKSPKKYFHKYIARDWPEEPYKKSFRIGTAVHMLVLEPELAKKRLILCPHTSGTKAHTKFVYEALNGKIKDKDEVVAIVGEGGRYFNKENEPHYFLDAEEWCQVQGMAESVLSDPKIKYLLHHGEAEVTGVAETESGRKLSCRGDLRGKYPDGQGYFLDIKTIESISEYGITSQIFTLGYWLQQFHYLNVANLIEPNTYKYFYFLFVEKQFPYECVLVHLELSKSDHERLSEAYEKTLENLEYSLDRHEEEGDAAFLTGTNCKFIRPPGWFISKVA